MSHVVEKTASIKPLSFPWRFYPMLSPYRRSA
ncbi:hypothetical protein NC651_000718 [Populus alba x Populus x berolinensis]|nr:hypothetical protein NC651_000718 [Populus alba x Populus x berolinensis]